MNSKVILLKDLKDHSKDFIVYGGTFDPIHKGHLSVVKVLLKSFNKVILAPTDQNPWKKSDATPLKLRKKMLELVLKAEELEESIEISDISYIYAEEFVRQLRENLGNSSKPVYWAIGEDSLDSAPNWRNFDKLNLTVVAAPVSIEIHATEIRKGGKPAHPALTQFIRENELY